MYLSVVAEIKAYHQAVVVDSLGVDDIGTYACRLVNGGKGGAGAARENEPRRVASRRKLADNITLVVDSERIDRAPGSSERLQRAAVRQEKGRRAVAADHVVGAVNAERDLAATGVEWRRGSRRARKVRKNRVIVRIHLGANDLPGVADSIHVGPGRPGDERRIEVDKGVPTRRDRTADGCSRAKRRYEGCAE